MEVPVSKSTSRKSVPRSIPSIHPFSSYWPRTCINAATLSPPGPIAGIPYARMETRPVDSGSLRTPLGRGAFATWHVDERAAPVEAAATAGNIWLSDVQRCPGMSKYVLVCFCIARLVDQLLLCSGYLHAPTLHVRDTMQPRLWLGTHHQLPPIPIARSPLFFRFSPAHKASHLCRSSSRSGSISAPKQQTHLQSPCR